MPEAKIGGKIEDQALALVENVITGAGYELWDVIYEKEGAMWYLKILFDKPHDLSDAEGGISSVECEEITEPINKLIDKANFIDKIDILEVGSPGLTRRLRKNEHFKTALNSPVVAAIRDEKGKTVYMRGKLTDFNEETGEIFIDNQPLIIKKCIKINLDL